MYKPNRKVDRVFIHCSASDHAHHDDVSVMDKWHKQRGWSGVGYHFFIKKDGTIQSGRSLEKTPAAQGGNNRGTIAICLHGLDKDKFTDEQYSAVIKLCQELNNLYDGNLTFHGHCEVSAKSCPVFDYKKILKLNSIGQLGV